MFWILSILCPLLFIASVRWQPASAGIAVALNLVLAVSCVGLLIISRARQAREGADERPSAESSARVRNIIVTSLILIYLAASLVKLNGSSTALWLQFADRQSPTKGLIAGTAKGIRMDEWMAQTPWIWSQANQDPPFPLTNRNVGNGAAPLLTNLPVAHWTMFFRPQMWGFFALDRERAFAFNWNFKWVGLLLGGFLFLRIIARGNNFLALGGALILLFSPYVQWFFSTLTCMPEMISMVFIGLWALDLLFRTKSRWAVAGAGAILLIAIEQFVFCCYPRFQIPLVYLALALVLAGWFRHRSRSNKPRDDAHYFRICVLGAVLITAAGLLWQWHREVASSVNEVQSLIYPGQSVSKGGSFPWYFFLAPFLEFSMTQDHFPSPFANVCDASGFLFIAPILAVAFVRDAWQRRFDAILLALILFLAGAIFFMLYGVPQLMARATGWSYVTSPRCILAVGVASVIGLVRYLALAPNRRPDHDKRFAVAIALLLTPMLFGYFHAANSKLGHFVTLAGLIAAAIFFATVVSLLWQRVALVSCLLLLIPCLCSYGVVNPIGQGLPGITRSGMFRWFSRVHESDRGALWIVTGNLTVRTCFLAQLVKATGANVLGGTRCMPDREMLKVLDPEDRYASVHNRYAWVCFQVSAEPKPVFELHAPDYYLVRLPFQAELFESLQVKYVLVVDQAGNAATLPGFERAGELEGCVLLRRIEYSHAEIGRNAESRTVE